MHANRLSPLQRDLLEAFFRPWVLSQITIGDDAAIPGGVSPTELRSYLAEFIARLTRLSFPR